MFFNTSEECAVLGNTTAKWPDEIIEQATQALQWPLERFVRECGPVGLDVINILDKVAGLDDDDHVRVDTRSHMLKPGWYPGIPGWHCDFVSRTGEGKIEPHPRDEEIEHYLLVIGQPTTKFISDANVEVEANSVSWKGVSREVDKMLEAGELETFNMNSGDVIKFTGRTLHAARPAQESGWRYLFRATKFPEWHPQYDKHEWLNKERIHSQVYIEKNQGW